MKTNRLDNLVEKVNEFFNVDISENTRRSHNIQAKRIFFVKARQMRYSLQSIAVKANRSHAMVWVANQNHDANYAYDKFYRDSFDGFTNFYNLATVKEQQEENIDTLTDVQSSVLNDLKELSDSQLLEFQETRLRPFKKALESRIQPKVITHVAGATLNR